MLWTPLFRKRHPPVGARPGTLVVPEGAMAPRLTLIQYGPDTLERESDVSLDRVRSALEEPGITLIDVVGLGDEALLRTIGDLLGLHPLLLEDMVNVPQRPKAEQYDDLTLLVTRMLHTKDQGGVEQVSIIFGPGFVLTAQQTPGDVFDPVRSRLERGGGVIRELGSDYLAYALLDTIVDAYYPVLESMSDELEALETVIIEGAKGNSVARIYALKRALLELRRAVWPQREALRTLTRREDTAGFSSAVRVYLRDTYDHCVQITDVIETYREMASSLLDVYLSKESNRMNEVMKVLTIMASIFIPLTFIAGVYGMNFDYMPELHRAYAYPVVLSTMAATALGMVWWFRRKGWIGRR